MTAATILLSVGLPVVVYVWTALALGAVFRKAGEPAWKAWVPVYNIWTLSKIAHVRPNWVVAYVVIGIVGGAVQSLGQFSPATDGVFTGLVIGGILELVAALIQIVGLAITLNRVNHGLGLGVGFTVLGVILFPVWASIAGWGPSTFTRSNVPPAREQSLVSTVTGGRGISQYSMVVALVVIVLAFEFLTGHSLDPGNVINVVQQYSYIFILAIGMVMVIIAGHIDLSVGSVAAFVGIVVAKSMSDWHFNPVFAIILGLVVGALVGAWQGFWVAFVRVPAFIVTLAGQLIFRGANQIVGNSTADPTPNSYNWIGNGFLPDPNWGVNANLSTVIIGVLVAVALVYLEIRGRARRNKMGATSGKLWISVLKMVVLVGVTGYVTILFATGRAGTSFPVVGIIAGVLILIYSFVTGNTIFGRQIYAVGGNSAAAVLSGVSSRRINFFVMLNMSVLAAIAGMVFIGNATASGPFDGTGWELDAIAAVFVGGAAVAGGIGTVGGSIIGAFVMAFLTNGLSLMGADSDITSIVRGVVLLLAVAFDVYNKTQGRPSFTGALLRGIGIGRPRAMGESVTETASPENPDKPSLA